MKKTTYRFIQCLIVLGLATYLAEKWVSGRRSFYINPRFNYLTLLGIAVFSIMAILGLAQLFSARTPHHPVEEQPRASKKLPAEVVLLLVVPVIIAMLGLSTPIILSTTLIVILIGVMRLRTIHSDTEEPDSLSLTTTGTLLIIAIPLLLGALVPAQPLSTSSLSTRGMSLNAPASLDQQSLKTMELAPNDQTILDWIKIFNYQEDLTPYLEQEANVLGFVYHDARLAGGQFMVGRFVITCCAADAFAIGMAVDWSGSANLPDNTWVNVKGPVDVLTIDGTKVPFIHAKSVTPVDAPEQPYLYP